MVVGVNVGNDAMVDHADQINTLGDVPRTWYRGESHVGYGRTGVKLSRSKAKDGIDALLHAVDDRSAWRTLTEETRGHRLRLSAAQVKFIRQLELGAVQNCEQSLPLTVASRAHNKLSQIEPKRRFIPSQFESRKVLALVRNIRQSLSSQEPTTFATRNIVGALDIWFTTTTRDIKSHRRLHARAPRPILAGHDESYNAPLEYSMIRSDAAAVCSRSLRSFSSNANLVKESFNRCLDLYLCPRIAKQTIQVKPASLLPQIANPTALRPFPISTSTIFSAKKHEIISISVDTWGELLATGASDCTLRIWEISSGRCLSSTKLEAPVVCVSWRPGISQQIAACSDREVLIVSVHKLPCFLTPLETRNRSESGHESWISNQSGALSIFHANPVRSLTWHAKGDYFSTLEEKVGKLFVHRISTRSTQLPFIGEKTAILSSAFHPFKPLLITAAQSQSYLRVIDMREQRLVNKLKIGNSLITSLSVSRSDACILVGTHDSKVYLFDVEVSDAPCKVIQLNSGTVLASSFHNQLPLFAVTLSSGLTQIFHRRVMDDILRTPVIVPLKALACDAAQGTSDSSDCVFHGTQPWIFASWRSKVTLFVETGFEI